MAQSIATRRAGAYRHRANDIENRQLPHVRDEADRRHMLNLVETYRRVADQLAPAPSHEPASQILRDTK
jgi:hypothetical protein